MKKNTAPRGLTGGEDDETTVNLSYDLIKMEPSGNPYILGCDLKS
jgi:hypothetical protein